MTNNEYGLICDKIIFETMKYIDTTPMKRYSIDKNNIHSNGDAIYKSAIASAAPITLVYTPAGTGKSALIKDRVHVLQNIGVPNQKIMILNMNIAKVKQMKKELPNINIMTFSDFIHNIFIANYPSCQLSDINSIANELRLYNTNSTIKEFINKLSITNPQDRMTLLTLFVNNHIDDIINALESIHKSDYALESMICQNKIYEFKHNPYDVDAILINGINNMPIPILCSILSYVNKYKCNLFITGSPEETIYEFNMAYANGMNILSSYKNKQIDIIRLNQIPKMNEDIKNVLYKTPTAKINNKNVKTLNMKVNYDIPMNRILKIAMIDESTYIKDKLNNNESILILAKSKADISDIKQTIIDNFMPLYPNLNILDLTAGQFTETSYGQIASKHFTALSMRYPNGITTGQLFYELYNILNHEISIIETPYKKALYQYDIDNIIDFANKHLNVFIDINQIFNVKDIITLLINIESDIIQSYMNEIQKQATIDISNTNIILSTIHSAIDIRNDNVIVFMKNNNDKIDEALYRVALSRANKSEYLIFANYGNFETSYQRYLKTHI